MDPKFVRRLCLISVGATAVVFALAMISLFLYRRDQLLAAADADARSSLYMASSLIGDRLEITKTAVINSTLPESKGESRRIVENLLRCNSDIYGCAIALNPEVVRRYNGKDRFMIYSYRTPADTLSTFMISDSIEKYFHYPERDWYRHPVEDRTDYWTEPYRDTLTSHALMVSFSHPIVLQDTMVVGVLLADITLDEGITSIVDEIDSGSDHRTYLLSREGMLVFGDTTDTANAVVYTRNLPETGWTLGHIIDKDTLFRPLRKEFFNMAVLFLMTVVILCITIFYTISWMTRPAVKKHMRIEAELDVATRIQEGMLPAKPAETAASRRMDMASMMRPAKEVGGDLYNYLIEDDKLYFIIGDVSGKGVPAALIMAIATEMFMVSAPGKTDPADIIKGINRTLCRNNKENMFVTIIVGILDIGAGRLKICNAGHNMPILVSGGEEKALKVENNIPTGVLDDYPYQSEEVAFTEGSTLVLYTDGVTEAENTLHQQFGESRLMEVIRTNRGADVESLRAAIEKAIDAFTAGYEQSDDITLFIFRSPVDKQPPRR